MEGFVGFGKKMRTERMFDDLVASLLLLATGSLLP
jgi:hypothetical protein